MPVKYPRSAALAAQSRSNEPAYVTWSDEKTRKLAFNEISHAIANIRTTASNRRDYSDLATNVSGRPGLRRSDYEWFRPDEAIPTKYVDILQACDEAYQQTGLVKNIIDLMGDFACQGIRLAHKNKRIQKFYQNWFERVKGKERSERFLNTLYRLGNVVIKRQTAKVTLKQSQKIFRSAGKADKRGLTSTVIEPEKREIPWNYTFLNPKYVDVVGGPLAAFVGKKVYGINLPRQLKILILSPRNKLEEALVAELPTDIILAAQHGRPVPLNPDKVLVYHYKKDDWQSWANPMIYSIMREVLLLGKLKLADAAALDGAVSNFRIFKLGSFEHRIFPNDAAFSKLAEILESNVGGGTIDILWGPDIEVYESRSEVHKFLGEEKYKPTLNSLYAGLGIPPTLTGTFGAAGTTNNFISLKTLTERLKYGRDMLEQFWMHEVLFIQKAMGFRFPAQIEFDRMNLADDVAEKTLLVQLADRNLISDELLQRHFGHEPDIEKVRIRRENREKSRGTMPAKSSPMHDANPDLSLQKIALQSGVAAPSEVGLELDEKKEGEMNALEMRGLRPSNDDPNKRRQGNSQRGRPKNARDKQPRQKPTFRPKSRASLEIWARESLSKIGKILNPGLLVHFDKLNMRSLSAAQTKESESIKFGVLFNLEPFSKVNKSCVGSALSNGKRDEEVLQLYMEEVTRFAEAFSRQPTLEDARQIQAYIYAQYKGEADG